MVFVELPKEALLPLTFQLILLFDGAESVALGDRWCDEVVNFAKENVVIKNVSISNDSIDSRIML